MDKVLSSEKQFLGHIVIDKQRLKVCIPPGKYGIHKVTSTYVVLDLHVRYEYKTLKKSKLLQVRVLKSRLNPSYKVIKGFIEWNTNEVNSISFTIVPDLDEPMEINSKEYFNRLMADYLGLELTELESELMKDKIYSWDYKDSGITAYEGVYGCKYRGEAPPFDRDMNWLAMIIEKIRSHKGLIIKDKPCTPEFQCVGNSLYLYLNENKKLITEFEGFQASYYKLCTMFMALLYNN